MNKHEIEKRFDHHPPGPRRMVIHEDTRALFKKLAIWLDMELPDSREKSEMMTLLETAMMWANACVARNLPEPSDPDMWPREYREGE